MIRSIQINENQSVEVNSSAGWLLLYRETFGRDILPDILPVAETVITAAQEVLAETEDDLSTKAIMKALSNGALIDALGALSTLELVTIIKILWALAKNNDREIPTVYDWANSFETISLDTVAPDLLFLIVDSFSSSKNSERLKELTKRMRGTASSTSTQFSSGLMIGG